MLTQLPKKLLFDIPKTGNHSFATYHPHYKEKLGITLPESAHDLFLFRLLLKPLSLTDILSDSVVKFTIYHPHYKEILRMTKCTYDFFFFWPPSQLSSLPSDLPNCVGKFAIYHPHYKNKFVGNPARALVCATDNLYFLSNFGNFSASLKKRGGENRRELPYIFFLTFSNFRLYFSVRRSPKCTRQCLNT